MTSARRASFGSACAPGGAAGAVYVSTNTGTSFTKAAGSLGAATTVVDIAPHPTIAGTIYVSTDKGLFKSSNYGATIWAPAALPTRTGLESA